MENLIVIMLIVALIFESGFWDSLDSYVNERFKFHHLPHLLMCPLCQTWWLSLLYITVTGNLSLFNILLCIINAHLVDFMPAIIGLIKNIVFKLIDIINNVVDYIK